jgi:hypothetical protein
MWIKILLISIFCSFLNCEISKKFPCSREVSEKEFKEKYFFVAFIETKFSSSRYCTGGFITQNHVLGLAQCVYSNGRNFQNRTQLFKVKSGSNDESMATTMSVQKIAVHECFNQVTLDYDFAIFMTVNKIPSIQLPTHGYFLGSSLYWGASKAGRLNSKVLKIGILNYEKSQFGLTPRMFGASEKNDTNECER